MKELQSTVQDRASGGARDGKLDETGTPRRLRAKQQTQISVFTCFWILCPLKVDLNFFILYNAAAGYLFKRHHVKSDTTENVRIGSNHWQEPSELTIWELWGLVPHLQHPREGPIKKEANYTERQLIGIQIKTWEKFKNKKIVLKRD